MHVWLIAHEKNTIQTSVPHSNNDMPTMSLHPEKFNVNGWVYKKLSDIKFRSNFMEDNLNGRYCNRAHQSKTDAERFKPNKIFKSMYQKAYQPNSRNGAKTPVEEPRDLNRNSSVESFNRGSTFKTVGGHEQSHRLSYVTPNTKLIKGNSIIDLVSNGLEVDRDITTHPRNDYTPDFTSSLNFNFNSNDVFGVRTKKASAMSLLTSSANRNGTIMPKAFIEKRNSIKNRTINIDFDEDAFQGRNQNYITTSNSNADDSHRKRREINNQILKNQYSFWAGQYMKKQNGGRTPGVPAEQQLLQSKQDIAIVDFGDPRSLTQCLNFSRKKLPYLPEQEIKRGGGVPFLPPPPRKSKQEAPTSKGGKAQSSKKK